MAIQRVEIKDFLVFRGEFACDFCPGVNILIGGNATGKTTLLKAMYWYIKGGCNLPAWIEWQKSRANGEMPNYLGIEHIFGNHLHFTQGISLKVSGEYKQFVFIPEKDILEHAKGLLTFIEQKQTGFSLIYKDVLIDAQDIPTRKQSVTQAKIGKMIADTIDGTVHWDKGDGSFYTLRTDGTRIPFVNEASGFKKLGFLGLLVASGQLENGSVLFWDEPENSISPILAPVLAEILLELQRGGVQIFITTHSYPFTRYFGIKKEDGDDLMFYNLTKEDDGQITVVSSAEYRTLPENILDDADEALYRAVVRSAMGR